MEPNKVLITKDRVILKFPNGRTLNAPKSFFEFIGSELAEPTWKISDLVNDDQIHRISCDNTKAFPGGEEKATIWFANKYLKGCAITTIYEWYINRKTIGKKITGKKLPNGQKVSDRHIVLP